MTSAPTPSPSSLLSLNDTPLLRAAHAYASMGWPVLPLKPQNKAPANHNGLTGASTDAAEIAEWWTKWPQANIGLRTGDAFDVLDVDGQAGIVSLGLSVLEEKGTTKYLHPGPVQSTGKGYHLLFTPTGARNFAGKHAGLDFRGQRGYIVAAPSVHPNGHKYRWVRDEPLPEPPSWLNNMLTQPRTTPPSSIDPSEMEPIVEAFHVLFAATPDIAPLQALGSRFVTNCIFPDHDDSTPSFVLYPESNSYYCFGCDEWGDTLDLENYGKTGTKPSEARATRTRAVN